MKNLKEERDRLFALNTAAQQMNKQSIFKAVRQFDMHPESGLNDVLKLVDGLNSAVALIREQDRLLALAAEALEYYADKGNYYCAETQLRGAPLFKTNADEGDKAQKALAALKATGIEPKPPEGV